MPTLSKLAPQPWLQFIDANGNPYVNGTLRTFTAGTATPLVTYTSAAGTVANPTQIPLNSAGIPSLTGSPVEVCIPVGIVAKFEIWDSTPALVATYDYITGINDFTAPQTNSQWIDGSYTGIAYNTAHAVQFVTLTDQTSIFEVGRRIRVYDGSAYHYGTISTSTNGSGLLQYIECLDLSPVFTGAFGASPTISYGVLTSTANSVPLTDIPNGSTATTQALTDSTTKLATTAFVNNNVSPSIHFGMNDFRLTLTSGTPVTIADIATASTVYLTPYSGEKIGIYNTSTSSWDMITSTEISIALTGMTANQGCDIFAYSNSGVLTLSITPWGSVGSRSTSISKKNGIYVKSADEGKRYVGTVCALSATTTCDADDFRYLWNYYNRVNRFFSKQPTGTHGYPTATWREFSGVAGAGKAYFMVGVVEDCFHATLSATCTATATAAQWWAVGIGLNVVSSAPSGVEASLSTLSSLLAQTASTSYSEMPILGQNYLSIMQYAVGAGITFIGTSGSSGTRLNAMYRA